MKKVINIIIGIIIVILVCLLFNQNKYEREDVNRDGEVNALDLLIVQKHILKEMEEDK